MFDFHAAHAAAAQRLASLAEEAATQRAVHAADAQNEQPRRPVSGAFRTLRLIAF